MADLSYTVDVNTTPAQRNLDNLNKKLAGVRNAFSSLGAAIAGLAVGSAIRSVIQYADALQDLSDATDIAVVDLVTFQKAVELSGGTAEVAQVSVQKLALSINEAASGSAKTQAAFRDVGVSIENLRKLSERDILIKTVQGLAQIDDASKRAALATDLLGKSARGLNFKNVADELGTSSIAAQKAADSYRKLADFQDKLDRSGQKLRESIANVVSPLLDKINQIPQDKLNAMIEAFVKLAAAITALVVVLPIIERIGKGIIYLGGAMATAYAAFKLGSTQFVGGFASIAKTAGIAKDYIDRFIRGTPQFDRANGPIKNMATLFEKLAQRIPYAGKGLGIMIAGLGRMIPLIGGVITALALLDQALKLLTGNDLGAWFDKSAAGLEEWVTNKFPKLAAAINAVGEKLGMAPPPSAMAEAQKAHDNEMKRILERSKALQESVQGNDRNREVVDATAKLYQEHAQRISEIRLEYQQLVSASRQHSDQLQSDLRFQIAKLKMSEDEIEMAEALRNETQRYLDLRNDLDKKFSKTSLDLANEQQKRKTANDEEKVAIDLRIQQLQEELDQIRKLGDQYYQNHIANGKAIEQELGQLQRLRFEEKQRIADMERMGQLIEAQIQRQQVLGDALQSANDKLKDVQFQGDQQRRNPLEQQLANIQEEARKAALEAGRAFAASFEGMDLTSEQAQELANGLEQIAQKYQLIAQEQTKQLEYSRSWEAGWKDAFDKYMDNATNAAMRAGEVFGSITRNMESAIDRFVETGKFSFKDFARSIIQDLIKIELKAQATQLLKAIGGSGGIFSAIGSLFGFANGGNPPINKPSIVGENGPELFVPKSAGTIIPNGATQGIMNGIGMGAVQAPVTNNYITNNISALDAKSVAQLFAENRKTLLGTVEMARKEMPYYNR